MVLIYGVWDNNLSLIVDVKLLGCLIEFINILIKVFDEVGIIVFCKFLNFDWFCKIIINIWIFFLKWYWIRDINFFMVGIDCKERIGVFFNL